MPKVPSQKKSSPKVPPMLQRPTEPKTESKSASKNGSSPKQPPSAEPSKKPPTLKAVGREVKWEKVTVRLCQGSDAIDVDGAKKLLGWTEESENVKFGNDFLLKDTNDVKVRCLNNVRNRPLYMAFVQRIIQELLKGRWRLNGETIIIGRTGLVLNGQHRLVALILANQLWTAKQGQYQSWCPKAPTLEQVLVFGIAEEDATVNTMDTCKPRSLADVLYRSEHFAKLSGKDRRLAARTTDYAVQLLWDRTGAGLEAYSKFRTHAESLDFVHRHPKLLEAVQHISEENGDDNRLSRLISPGAAAGLLYLMGSARSERVKDDDTGYANMETPTEKALDWSLWDKACDFWVKVADGHKDVAAIRQALAACSDDEGHGLNLKARCAIMVNAWNAWSNGKSVTVANTTLKFEEDDMGARVLADVPTVGGIDLGAPEPADG